MNAQMQPLTIGGFEPGDTVCLTQGAFANGHIFGVIQRLEDAEAYVEVGPDLYRVSLSRLIMAL